MCFHMWFSTQEAWKALRAAFGHIKGCVSSSSVGVSCSWISLQYCEVKPKDESYFCFTRSYVLKRQQYKVLPSPGLFPHKRCQNNPITFPHQQVCHILDVLNQDQRLFVQLK